MAVKKKKQPEQETSNEVMVVEQNTPIRDADILSMDYSFDDKIGVATKVATSLKHVIQTQGLAVQIGKGDNNTYVTAEGWETLGTMLGCTPYVEEVVELEVPGKNKAYFAYKATVSIRQGDQILSRASAMAERKTTKPTSKKVSKAPPVSERITQTEKGGFTGKPVWGKFVNGKPVKKK